MDEIERIDNVAGLRREDSLNPLARSKRAKRRDEKSDEDITERSRKRPAEPSFSLEVDAWDHEESKDLPDPSATPDKDEEVEATEPPTAEEEKAADEPGQGIDVKI